MLAEYLRANYQEYYKRKGTSHSALFLKGMAMGSFSRVLVDFSFAGIRAGVDVYALFQFEPMHESSVGISRILKVHLRNMLSNETRKTSVLQSACDLPYSYEAVDCAVHFFY